MRALLAGLLGSAAGAPGRDVSVYREYSQPISFYDEDGERTEFAALAPDLAALRSVRELQAQEALMGKETLLEMSLGKNESVFAKSAPQPGKLTPPSGRDEGRRRTKSSGQNWLAKSLSLPSLGQTPTNAAAAAISAGARESSWGWLADEVVGATGLQAALSKDVLPEENVDPALAQPKTASGGDSAGGIGSPSANVERLGATVTPSSAEIDRGRMASGQKLPDRAVERSQASVRDLTGLEGGGATLPPGSRTSPGLAEMSQTRQMLADLSANARPDFASLRESLVSPSAGMPGKTDSARPAASPPMTPASGGGASWVGMGGRPTMSSGSIGYGSSGASGWQGGWRAQGTEGRRLTPFDPTPIPLSESVVPAASSPKTRPGSAGGGYKPAWH